MCVCNRNWQAADCSERVCQFGLAHVDTPKGDLDGSGGISGPDTHVVDNHYAYPRGTTEGFPQMEDTDLNKLENSAHFYMECSNKGTCDRSTGDCVCFDGYDGVACQRASCPGFPASCSGHGVCKTKRQLAWADNENVYNLWDKDATMGCECDSGYYGADCSQRQCKYGIDPLYLDDTATVKFASWDFATLSTNPTSLATPQVTFTDGEFGKIKIGTGKWAIRYFDNFGEDWLTEPILAGASCSEVLFALESLPNNVIPAGLTTCKLTTSANNNDDKTWYQNVPKANYAGKGYNIFYNLSIWEAGIPLNQGPDSFYNELYPLPGSGESIALVTALTGYIYRLRFFGNPGAQKQPQIEIYLDGKRPSLVSPGANPAAASYKVITKVWTDGQQGEYNDHFADHCDGVTATVAHHGHTITSATAGYLEKLANGAGHYLDSLTPAEKKLLKKCLGSSDFDTANNVDTYNWDYGSMYYPHLVKLVRTVTTYIDGGYYAAIYYKLAADTFYLVNPFQSPDAVATDVYEIYTTKGTLALTSNQTQAVFSFASNSVYITNSSYDTTDAVSFDGDISCEVGDNNADKFKHIHHCLNKTDLFTLLAWNYPGKNPPNINLYTAERLYTRDYAHLVGARRTVGLVPAISATNTKALTDQMHYMTHVISTDISTNWGSAFNANTNVGVTPVFRVYKFFPSSSSTYNYVAPCSNRGICQTDSGLCACFPGYTNDDCSVQNSIAL